MEDGLGQATEVGTPQGAMLSPLLSHVSLHYVLDSWFQRRMRRRCRGEAYLSRFADDFVAGFQYQTEADDFLESLGKRLEEFHLELAPEKTRQLECGRYARANAYPRGEKPKECTVLGMPFFCGKTRQGAFKVNRYRHLTRQVLFKWLNRRSQRKAYTWAAFQQALRHVGWPQVRIRINLHPFATLNA
jgi:hypothetical protein